MRQLFLALALALLVQPALAIFNETPLPDPAAEARAQHLMKELRCLVCQNQAISESNAPLARDLREVLRERVAAGDTDTQALDYMVQRFGDWVLLRPPFKPETWLLWLGPLLILVPGGILAARYLRRRPGPGAVQAAAPLSASEQAEIARALKEQE